MVTENTEDLVRSHDYSVIVHRGAQAVVTTNTTFQRQVTPVDTAATGSVIAEWGSNNLFPQEVVKDANMTVIIPPTLDRQARILQSSGLMYGYKDDNGEFVRIYDQRIEDFWFRSNIDAYLNEACSDFYWFFNLFPNFQLSLDRKQIVSICIQEATFCRYGKQNDEGIIDKCYINANWDNGGTPDNSTVLPVIDIYGDRIAQVRDGDAFDYIYPVSYPTPGKVYYQLAIWNTVRTSKWIESLKLIPQLKKAIMENQMVLKYHIKISTWYWEYKYKGWESNKYSEAQRKAIIDKEVSEIVSTLTGADKAGKSVITHKRKNPKDGTDEDSWEIIPIEDKMQDGKYIDDSQEASLNVLYGLGFDPILIGSTPGKGGLAGSGSDKRVAYNTYLSTIEPHRNSIVSPWDFAYRYNGWFAPNGRPIINKFCNSVITTLDQSKEPIQTAS